MNAQEPPYLYLTTTGWKSGKPHQIEIWFIEQDGRYYLSSDGGYKAHWVQNLQRHPAITFQVGTKNAPMRAAQGRVISNLETDLLDIIKARFDAKYQWSGGLMVELTPAA
jgi:deazaflavin-dependent oxidoreductase (nitroreductase family)